MIVAVVPVVLMAACSGGGVGGAGATADEDGNLPVSGVDESKPPLQPDGPLRGLILATVVAEDRSVIDPRLGFTTDDTEATALVGLGDDVPEGATLTIAWYRLTGVDGRDHLFSHEIVVETQRVRVFAGRRRGRPGTGSLRDRGDDG